MSNNLNFGNDCQKYIDKKMHELRNEINNYDELNKENEKLKAENIELKNESLILKSKIEKLENVFIDFLKKYETLEEVLQNFYNKHEVQNIWNKKWKNKIIRKTLIYE